MGKAARTGSPCSEAEAHRKKVQSLRDLDWTLEGVPRTHFCGVLPKCKADSNLRKRTGPREGGLRDQGLHLHTVQLKSGRSD